MPESLTSQQSQFQDEMQEFALEVQSIIQANRQDATSAISQLSKQYGIWNFHHPLDLGGRNPSWIEQAILYDTLGSLNLIEVPGVFGPNPGMLVNVQEPLRSDYLVPMLRGEKRSAFGFTEPDDAERATYATIEGEEIVVTGQKSYVTGGAEADFINTLVDITDSGPAMVLIDRQAKGLTIEKQFRSTEGSRHAYIKFDKVRVPRHNIVGRPGEGLPRAMEQITNTRFVFAARSVGLARWVIEFVSNHIQAPHRSGQPLASREGVRLRYAEMRIKAFAARAMVYRTARLGDAAENIVNETIAAKVFATETIDELVDTAIQLVGGNALRAGHPLESLHRNVRTWRIAEGANDILRLNLVRGDLDLKKGRI